MRYGRILLAALVVWGVAGAAGAVTISFEDPIDFSGSGWDQDNKNDPLRSYLEVTDLYTYTHFVGFNPAADEVLTAQIVLSHKLNDRREQDTGQGNGFNPAELWFLSSGADVYIGQLDKSENHWVDQTFVLPASLLSGISGSSWTLALKVWEDTSGLDSLWLDKSVLTGTYRTADSRLADDPISAVPEPSTLVLLGSGLLALARARRAGRGKPLEA